MPGNALDVKTSKHLRPTVTFLWGDPQGSVSYVCWDSDLADFTAARELEVRPERQHGGVEDSPFVVQMAVARPPFDRLLRPFAHAPVTVQVGELDPYHPETYRLVFEGRISQSTRNASGLQGLGRATVSGKKARLQVSLGLPCLGSCDHVLGDQGCGVDLAPHRATAVVTAVSGNRLAVTLGGGPWPNGEAYYDGLALLITDVADGGVLLARLPPPEWAGKAVRFTHGCDKKIDGDCRTVYANENRFLGLGVKMPDYHPMFESP